MNTLRIENALIRVAETLTRLAFVARDELSRPPSFLVEHRTTRVAMAAASVVLANALIVLFLKGFLL